MNENPMRRILITGGAGFIGTHLAQRLCEKSKIVIFDNFHRDSLKAVPELQNHPNIELIEGNVLHRDFVQQAVNGCDIVVHMAAIAGVSSYYKIPDKTLKVNLIGTFNVLESCKTANIKKIIDFSTSEVYGPDAFDVREDSYHLIGPVMDLRWTYAVSKVAGENLTHRYGERYGFKSFTVRPFNIYGPRQTGEGAIANFFRAVVQGEPLQVYDDGASIRAWCYISDCIDAVEVIIEKNDLGSDIFNIGNPRAISSTLDLAKTVLQATGKEVPIKFKQVSRTDIRVRVPNIDKARKLLGYEPKVDLLEGLKKTYRSFLQEA